MRNTMPFCESMNTLADHIKPDESGWLGEPVSTGLGQNIAHDFNRGA